MIVSIGPVPSGIQVDCDRGESLQEAIDLVTRQGGGTVHFSGTCQRINVAAGFVELVGDGPRTSRIEGGQASAISAEGQGFLEVRGAGLSGNHGLTLSGSQRVVFLRDSEVKSEFIGVRADSRAAILVSDTVISGGEFGVRAVDSEVVLERTLIRDSGFGVRCFGSRVALVDTDLLSNTILGLQALERSTVSIQRGSFAENASSHINVQQDSHLESLDTQLGGPEDSTDVLMQAGSRAHVGLFAEDPAVEHWGTSIIVDDSFIRTHGVKINGSLALRRFARVVVDSQVTGIVECRTGADATCDSEAMAFTNGCTSAPDACSPQ